MLDDMGKRSSLHPTFILHSSNFSSNVLDEMLDWFASAFNLLEERNFYGIYSINVAEHFDINIGNIKTKINGLRAQLGREMVKEAKTKIGQEQVYILRAT